MFSFWKGMFGIFATTPTNERAYRMPSLHTNWGLYPYEYNPTYSAGEKMNSKKQITHSRTYEGLREWRKVFIPKYFCNPQTSYISYTTFILRARGETFRPSFKALGRLRSQFENAPVLMLTATLTEEDRVRVFAALHLKAAHVQEVVTCPDRWVSLELLNHILSFHFTSCQCILCQFAEVVLFMFT